MYSLPITTYSDCWRATKAWSSYIGGLAMFAASTQYSTLNAHDLAQRSQRPLQQTAQCSNNRELDSELSILDFRQRLLSQNPNISQEMPIQISLSRGLSDSISAERENNQELNNQATSKIQVEEKEIPFETQYDESDQIPPGMSQIKEEGDNGLLRQVVKTYEVGGQPVKQQVQSTSEVRSPKKRVIIRNSKPAVGENFDLSKLKISQTLEVEATAYTYTGNKTASGLAAREGLIAVDPKVIAMGSKVYVEGYGYALAADTGGDICGHRIDVFFSSFRKCINWGRRPVHIYVLKTN